MDQIFIWNITYYDILTQGIGFIGVALMFISFQQNSNSRILLFQIMASFVFFTHFFMLGAYSGAIINLFGALRNIIFFNREKKWASSILWLYAFCLIYIAMGILTWNGYISIFPTLGMILGSLALYSERPKITRRLSLPTSLCWITYNIFSFSIAGTICEILSTTSIIISIIKYDRKKYS